jgi:hypothetical protein
MGPVLGLDHHFQVHGLRWQISENTLMDTSTLLAPALLRAATIAPSWPGRSTMSNRKGERKFGNNTFQ